MSAESTQEKGQVLFSQILREAMSISERATEALKALLTIGPLTLGEISTYSGLGYAVATKAMIELENEHLVRRIPGAVVRFTAMPPYSGFEAFLKDFQKIVKSISDIANKSMDLALTAVSRNVAELRREAQQAAKSASIQMTSDSESLKESSSKDISDMLGKLKQETDATRGMATDAVKKHVDEHKMKMTETGEGLASGIDNVTGKFEATGKKYLKELTDAISVSLTEYKNSVQTFTDALRTVLQQYDMETKESLALLEREITETQNGLEEKHRTVATTVKTRSFEALDSQRKLFGQKSLEIQAAVREAMDNLTKTVSNYLARFKSYIDDMMEKLSTEVGGALSEFEGRTAASLTERGSRFKSDITECVQSIGKTVDTLGESLAREEEKLGSFAKGLVGNFGSLTQSYLEDMKSKVEQAHSARLANLTATMSTIKKDLDGVLTSVTSSCKTITSSLESTSSTIVPRYSTALEAAASDFEKNAPRTMLRITKKIDASVSAVTDRAVDTVSSSIPALRSEVNKTLERVLAQVTPTSNVVKPSGTGAKKGSGTAKTFTSDVKDLFSEVLERFEKNLTSELRESLTKQARIEKSSFEEESKAIADDIGSSLSTIVRNAKLELGKGNVVTAGMLPKLAEYSSSVERLVKQVKDTIDVSVKQYAGESELTRRVLEGLLSKQKVALEGILKQASEGISTQQASSAKEVNDLVTGVRNSLDSTLTKHLDETDQDIQRVRSDLSVLATQATKSVETTRAGTQMNITNQVNSTLKTSRDAIESMSNSTRTLLSSTVEAVDNSTSNLQKDLNTVVNQSVEEVKSILGESAAKVSASRESASSKIDEISGRSLKEFGESSRKHGSETLNTILTMSASLTKTTSTSLDAFKSEAIGAKERFHRVISSHLQQHEQDAFGISGTSGYLLNRSYEKHREVSMVNERKLGETLLTSQTRCENTLNTMNSSLAGLVERNEALLKEETKNALTSFRDNIEKLMKASSGAELVLHSAWMELENTPQLAAEKTWQAVSRTAIMSHIQEMVKRTRSNIVIVLPTLKEAPLEDIRSVRKATRVTLVVSDIKGDQKEAEMLTEMSRQANISIRAGPDLSCFGCSRDNEEMLFAPVAPADGELVGVVSTMDNYVQFFERIILPALLGSSRDLKEPAVEHTPPKKS